MNLKVPGSFVKGLSKEVSMKTLPSTILYLALGYFSLYTLLYVTRKPNKWNWTSVSYE